MLNGRRDFYPPHVQQRRIYDPASALRSNGSGDGNLSQKIAVETDDLLKCRP